MLESKTIHNRLNMAGNKINPKTKGKEDRGKGSKSVNQNNEEGEDMDFAVLRKPIPTSITGFAQARKIFDLATEELKDLLTNECDLMYECKVCRNIFRSLANFISHKRMYCTEKFNTSLHGHFVSINSTATEIKKIQRTEKGYQESLKEKKVEVSNHTDDNDDRIPLTKDITAVYEKIMKQRGVYSSNETSEVVLQKIPSSSVAVFQNMKNEKCSDKMRTEINELDNILSCDKAVLQNDGQFIIESSNNLENSNDHDAVIQISDDDDDDSDILKCKICDLQFSTQKTLKFHMKYKHLESRLVYPCPDCLEIFSTSWSVYRHLFKVHRKTAAQIRRLRESIQAKAFKMNNRPAFYEKRKAVKIVAAQKITEEERLDQENQAWMDNMEGDGEVPRCGGCGRTFERRAALAAHTHTCQPRSRALARRPDAKKIEIQIRKDYNKSTTTGLPIIKAIDTLDNKAPAEDVLPSKPQPENDKPPENDDRDSDELVMDIADDDQKSNGIAESPEKNPESKLEDISQPVMRLPFAMQTEKSNLAAFKRRIQPDIVFYKLLCKKCDKTLASPVDLFNHMADHVKWMRYACKLCNFKHYNFEHLPEHVKTVHKLKGDKDFYSSTVKAIDGTEAMIISKCLTESETADDAVETNDTSPESRRPSRCSSDSSRLSDDSSSSNTIKESGSRKRKMHNAKNNPKRKKDAVNDDGDEQKDEVTMDKVLKSIIGDGACTSNVKPFEENSSDMDDIEDKISKRPLIEVDVPPATSRRPVRKRTKPKHEDFEYDLSNLLKMEAQGYRDSLSITTTKTTQSVNTTKTTISVTNAKTTPAKKERKIHVEVPNNFEVLNKDCCGALVTLSKKAVDKAAAVMKTSCFVVYGAPRPNIFVRPMIPRILSRGDKGSPKKDITDDLKDGSGTTKPLKGLELVGNHIDTKEDKEEYTKNEDKDTTKTLEDGESLCNDGKSLEDDESIAPNKEAQNGPSSSVSSQNSVSGESDSTDNSMQRCNTVGGNVPAVVPMRFRRQSLEIIKNNPIISKNITDFTKAGMKTKILVIKPINRKKDGGATVNTPLKFQTIKLKDPSKSSSDDKQPDQVMVVKVPKVPCATATVSEKPVLVNASVVDIVNNHDSTEKKCEAKDIEISTENKARHESELSGIDSNEAVTSNSDGVSDITIKDSVGDSGKSEGVESAS